MSIEVIYRESGRDALSDICHTHDNMCELIQIISGRGKVIVGKHVFSFDGDSLFLIDGATQHYICPDSGCEYLRNKLILDKWLLSDTLGKNMHSGVIHRIPTREHAEQIDREFAATHSMTFQQGQELIVRSQVFKLLYLCIVGISEPGVKYCGIVADVVRYIHENISQGITLSEVSDALYINKNYLCRLFKKETGMTVNAYITSARISRARHLLRTTEHSITHIAGEVGFGDLCLFTKNFKKEIGLTPREYRSQMRNARKEIV